MILTFMMDSLLRCNAQTNYGKQLLLHTTSNKKILTKRYYVIIYIYISYNLYTYYGDIVMNVLWLYCKDPVCRVVTILVFLGMPYYKPYQDFVFITNIQICNLKKKIDSKFSKFRNAIFLMLHECFFHNFLTMLYYLTFS